MAFDRFLIAPMNTGWETDLKPWLIPDDAFESLDNMYVFRGRVRKRFGSRYMGVGDGSQLSSRLAINIGTTDGSGDLTATVPGIVFQVGQAFSIGNEILTVSALGTPGVLLTTGASTTHTFNTTSGQFIVLGAAINTIVYYYPSLPVMGIEVFQNGPTNNQPTFAFDTQFAYTFDVTTGHWQWSNTAGAPVFTGSNSQFFWVENYRGTVDSLPTLFVTNYNFNLVTPADADHMWAYSGGVWSDFSVQTIFQVNGGTQSFVQSCRIIVAWKGRLLLLNTVEQAVGGGAANQYVNRLRYSAIGSPFDGAAWLEDNNTYTVGPNTFTWRGASFLNAATQEAIIGAEFIKDRLVVFFEASTWEIAHTGNENYPFVWNKLNTELGSQSTFSTVPFDKVVLAIGNTGVHACNGSNVERIDTKIPDKVFNIPDPSTQVARIWGIRDYYTEMVYWSAPTSSQLLTQPYPSQVLVYNYRNNAWALNDDTITAFGYFQQQVLLTWQNWHTPWNQSDWPWAVGPETNNSRQVIAGNQQGYIYLVDSDVTSNCSARQVTNIVLSSGGSIATFTVIDHMLVVGQYIRISNPTGITGMSGNIYVISTAPTSSTFTLLNPTEPLVPWTGTYTGGGTISLVSNYNVVSKQWNPYVSQDRNVYLSKIDFGVTATENGQVTVDYYVSSSSFNARRQAFESGTIVGTGILETSAYENVPREEEQERLWHPVYFQGDGECVQIRISMSPLQITDPLIALEDFQIEGMALYTMATSSRLQ